MRAATRHGDDIEPGEGHSMDASRARRLPVRPGREDGQEQDETGQGEMGEVLDLAAARAGRPGGADPGSEPDTAPDTGPDDDADAGPGDDADAEPGEAGDGQDAESLPVEDAGPGPAVDPADGVPAEVLARGRRQVKPIVPQWARSWRGVCLTARRSAGDAAYVAGYHLTRCAVYAAKAAWWAPAGAARTVARLIRWAMAEDGNWLLRQRSAERGDAETWLRLDRQRQRASRWRWMVTAPALVGGAVAVLLVLFAASPAWQAGVVLAAVPVLARLGRPEDRRITDRVVQASAYRKLTADLVRRGLTSLALSGINSAVAKDPGAISFPTEIHRDGPGHLAVVDLPYGVTAADVVARRGRLASALRLPLDQVWPETTRQHPGRLALWVGYEPASAMRPPPWPLLKADKVDVFKPFPFATDPRLRQIEAGLIFRNWLFGGQPGSGKTFGLRLLPLAAALDPRCELRIYELKGVGDFKALEPVCTEYGNGFDDETIAACAAMFEWLYAECQRRSKRIDFYAAQGLAPENKVTPELASLKGSGLHPLVVVVDEVQELFLHKAYGKAAGEITEKVIKLGRALGVVLLLGTQIPDKDSLPTGITRNVNTRFCLSVADHNANDMVLGTGAHKQGLRATAFEPGEDAGWGVAVGLGKPGSYKTYYVDSPAAARIVARAVALRQAAGTLPAAPLQRETAASADLLADLHTIWPHGEDAAWNDALCAALAGLRPDAYTGWEPAQLTTALKPHPAVALTSIGRRIDGKPVTRRGIRRADLDAAIAERNRRLAGG